jgi:curved DNA-binding protein CbpA
VEDPYRVPGVTREASADEIRAAYRKLAKQHHPDLNPGNEAAEERFKAISAVYELLSHPEKRGRYDRGEIDASGAERPPERPFYRGLAEGREGGKYHRGADLDAEDLNEIFASSSAGAAPPAVRPDPAEVRSSGFAARTVSTCCRSTSSMPSSAPSGA